MSVKTKAYQKFGQKPK